MGVMTELFETFDDDGRPTGLCERDVVHARGLWHKSAHVFLFNGSGDLYLQQRAFDKDVCPGLWDYSVGEHLKPGESFLAGAVRGLKEELAVINAALVPLGDVHRAAFRSPEFGVVDREIRQAFEGRHDGQVNPDPGEVNDVQLASMTELAAWLARAPDDFTPWFVADLERLGLLRRLPLVHQNNPS